VKKTVVNPDPEVRYSGAVHNVVSNCSATHDLQIRIHHCRKMSIDVERITVQLLMMCVALLQKNYYLNSFHSNLLITSLTTLLIAVAKSVNRITEIL